MVPREGYRTRFTRAPYCCARQEYSSTFLSYTESSKAYKLRMMSNKKQFTLHKLSSSFGGVLSLAVVAIFLLLVLTGFYFLGLTPRDRDNLLATPRQLEYGGVQRTYLVFGPETKTGTHSLVVALGGFKTTARSFAYFGAIQNVVDDNAVVVYPNPIKSNIPVIPVGWNAGFCCGSGLFQKTDDQGFILKLVKTMETNYRIDSRQVYLIGFSNGAMLAMQLANSHPTTFRGVAAVSGSIGSATKYIKPTSAVPLLLVHGRKDKRIPFNKSRPNLGRRIDFMDTLSAWQKANSCSSSVTMFAQTDRYTINKYNGCKQPLETIVYNNTGHEWPGARSRLWPFGESQPGVSRQIISFFKSLGMN